jgi:hypothetical protein
MKTVQTVAITPLRTPIFSNASPHSLRSSRRTRPLLLLSAFARSYVVWSSASLSLHFGEFERICVQCRGGVGRGCIDFQCVLGKLRNYRDVRRIL